MRSPLILFLLALPAAAHIELEAPAPRYTNTPDEQNKSCPCGAGNGNQTCTNATTSDANRNVDAVTTFGAGETVTVTWLETIGHDGRFRVAFDDDGADLDDFNANILSDIADPAGNVGNVAGNRWAVEVTLPDQPCTNCTLQLLQVMNGNTVDDVADPTGAATYFQCADIVITGDAAEGEGEGECEGEGEEQPRGCGAVGTGLPWIVLPWLRRSRRAPKT